MALFGMTTAEWRRNNAYKNGNIRDYFTTAQLVRLSNLNNLNALFIKDSLLQGDRLARLNTSAIHQMTLLTAHVGIKRLEVSKK